MFSSADDDNDVSLSEIITKPKLKDLVKFVCGHPYLPNDGLSLRVVFTRSTLPDAESRFDLIKLPLPHTTYEEGNTCGHQPSTSRLWSWLKKRLRDILYYTLCRGVRHGHKNVRDFEIT